MDHDVETTAGAVPDGEARLISAAWAQFQDTPGRARGAAPDDSGAFRVPGYRLLGEIHRGGQGVVYQAIQESTRRKVAIKMLKEGPFADRIELARFEREVDVLSRLDHPHIVTIHDRGLVAGHAYYVMDYIAGRPIDGHVVEADLAVGEILDLFIKVCEAVHTAHLRGVIHRDLKPGNILVDRAGEPHVCDFGLAKYLADPLSARTMTQMTRSGQFMGSLPWASPEQAEGLADQVDVRSDVYSLGIILYQLLTRRFPYPIAGRLDEVVRNIVHADPVRPSTIVHELDHDLELIVLKCLSKEPGRRYQSAGETVRDVRHYLAHEPVSATSPSTLYRLRKFVRRNRGGVAVGTALVATIMAAAGVSVAFGVSEARLRRAAETETRRAERAERDAQARAAELEQVATFQQQQLAGIDVQSMGVGLRAALLAKARAAAERSALSPEQLEERSAALEELIAGADFTGMAVDALEDNFFLPAMDAIEDQFSDQPLLQARLLQTLASTLRSLGLYDAASRPQAEALAMRRRELGDEHPDTLSSINSMGFLLRSQGKLAEAEPYFREALEKNRRVLGDDHPQTVVTVSNLGLLLQEQSRLAEAEPFLREGLDRSRRVLGDDHPDTLISIDSMGGLLWTQGKLTEAEPYFREAAEKRRRVLGEEHPNTLSSLNNLGGFLSSQGRLAEAEPYYREALEKRRRVFGDDHPDTLTSISNLGVLLKSQGKLTEAEPYYREALDKSRRLGDAHPDTLRSINNMGALLRAQGRLAEAEPYLREATEKLRRTLGDEHVASLMATLNLGGLLQAQGRSAEAIALLAPAEPAARRAFTGGNAVRLGRFLTSLGRARTAAGEFAAAESNLGEAQAILNEAETATERDLADVLAGLVELYEAWHAAEPDQGHDAKAAKWRTNPATPDRRAGAEGSPN